MISSAKRPQSPGDMLRHNAALKRKATSETGEPSPLKRKPLQRTGELYSNMLTPKKASSSTAQLYASMLGEGVSSPKVSASGSDAIVVSSDDDDQVPLASSNKEVARFVDWALLPIPLWNHEEWRCRYVFGYSLDDSDKPVFLVWPERTENNGFWILDVDRDHYLNLCQ